MRVRPTARSGGQRGRRAGGHRPVASAASSRSLRSTTRSAPRGTLALSRRAGRQPMRARRCGDRRCSKLAPGALRALVCLHCECARIEPQRAAHADSCVRCMLHARDAMLSECRCMPRCANACCVLHTRCTSHGASLLHANVCAVPAVAVSVRVEWTTVSDGTRNAAGGRAEFVPLIHKSELVA